MDEADGLAVADVDGGEEFELSASRASQGSDPVGEQLGAGVAGLLGVELGGPQRAVLHGGDERLAVRRPR